MIQALPAEFDTVIEAFPWSLPAEEGRGRERNGVLGLPSSAEFELPGLSLGFTIRLRAGGLFAAEATLLLG